MVNQEQVLEILHAIGEKISEEKLFLTELDNVIGDGDHGINLARGFAEVEKKRPMMEGKDIGTMLKTVGMALVSTVGGASGPLYGTAFMQAGKALAGKTELDAQDLVTILDAFVAGVQLRGKSVAGEKTMLDAMIPARDAVKAALDAGKSAKEALSDGVAAAEQGVEYTKTIIATKGRASYLGERSLGHQDPGATSFTTMLSWPSTCEVRAMVGFVIVSHSETLANGVVELTKMMADGVPIRAAGGLDGGGFGTSYEKISNAIEEIYSDDGMIVLMDMGSAVMTAEMVLEAMPERKLVLADCPLVEGAVAATVSAIAGSSLDQIMDELADVRELKKLS